VREGLAVVAADTDSRGAQKENTFIALDRLGEPIGSLFIYPFFAYDTEPEHPHNLYLHMQAERGSDLAEPVKDALLATALRRAREIKNETGQEKTRVYACFLKHQRQEITYFLRRGFAHDEGMLILARDESSPWPPVAPPEDIAIQPWRMDTDVELRQFIATHRRIFPRHPYSPARLRQLMSLPAWNNFTAWSKAKIAGNIMVFARREDDETIGTVEDLFVQRQWRRRGIAKHLLHTALVYFQDIGIHRVQLEMWSANKPALQLYGAFGFSPIDETEIAVGRYV
jgi:GNAT superfamily N-acetyltransferase